MKAGIDVHALEQDVDAALRLQDLSHELSNQEATLSRYDGHTLLQTYKCAMTSMQASQSRN